MRPRSLAIAVLATVAPLGLVAGGGYAYDRSREDVIADGIRIGGVDVGGLSIDAARARLRTRLVAPLRRPVVVVAGETRFPLGAREARTRVDAEPMLRAALRRSREGWFGGRAWRGVSGADIDARFAPPVTFDRPAVQRLVDKVRVQMSRKVRDAKVHFGAGSVTVQRARSGRTIDAASLRTRMWAQMTRAATDRDIRAKLIRIEPKVPTARVARRYPVVLTVDRARFRIRLFRRLKQARSYPIALGQAGLETPPGVYAIQNKAVNPAWSVPNSAWAGSLAGSVIPGGIPSNPLKARWMGVAAGVGVHGTSDRASIGTNASHGCIRMLVEDVVELYDEVPVGTPVYIS